MKIINSNSSHELVNHTVWVRILVEVEGYNQTQALTDFKIKVLHQQGMEMGFKFFEGKMGEAEEMAKQAITLQAVKLLEYLGTSESGFYEILGEWQGRVEYQNSQPKEIVSWKMDKVKTHQLNQEDLAYCPPREK